MTFEQAMAGYDDLSADEKSKTLYAHFGLAVYRAQMLEQQAINMIVIKNIADGKIASQEELDQNWLDYDMGKKTLGNLIRELRTIFPLDDALAQDLEEVLKRRNYIIHKYFRLNGEILQTDPGKKRMIKDFFEFSVDAKSVDSRLSEILDEINEKLGMADRIADEEDVARRDADTFSNDPNYQTYKSK